MTPLVLFQLYDSEGRPQLAGRSRVKRLPDWLELMQSWWGTSAEPPAPSSPGVWEPISMGTLGLHFRYDSLEDVNRVLFQAAAQQGKPFSQAALNLMSTDDGNYPLLQQFQLLTPTVLYFKRTEADSIASAGIGFARRSMTYRHPDEPPPIAPSRWSN